MEDFFSVNMNLQGIVYNDIISIIPCNGVFHNFLWCDTYSTRGFNLLVREEEKEVKKAYGLKQKISVNVFVDGKLNKTYTEKKFVYQDKSGKKWVNYMGGKKLLDDFYGSYSYKVEYTTGKAMSAEDLFKTIKDRVAELEQFDVRR